MSQLFETIEKENYKVLVTDTGLISSLVAAAVARLGHKVLHIDRDHTYGGDWKTLHLLSLIGWSFSPNYVRTKKDSEPIKVDNEADEVSIDVDYQHTTWHNIEADFSIFHDRDRFKQVFAKWIENRKVDDEAVDKLLAAIETIFADLSLKEKLFEIEEMLSKMKLENRLLNQLDNVFTVDLCPRLLLARSSMVGLLIRSNVSRYLEFRNVDRILAPIRDNTSSQGTYVIQPMPLNRSDVFQSKILSLIEKRLLMRFLQGCFESDKENNESFLDESQQNQPFEEFLRVQYKLSDKLVDIVYNSMLMSQKQMSTKEAIERIKKILDSMGRFSNRPYLWCAYGADDLLQSFCRYAAIYGADYCLGVETRSLLSVKQDDHQEVRRVVTDQFVASAEHVVTSFPVPQLVEKDKDSSSTSISRCVICSTRSILSAVDTDRSNNNSSLLYLPPSYTNSVEVTVFETNSVAGTVPDGLYLQYFCCDASTDADYGATKDLKPTVEKILPNDAIVWSVYYQQKCQIPKHDLARLPVNVHLVRPPANELDFELACQQAEEIFKQILPDEEFFPETKEPNEHGQEEQEEEEEEETPAEDKMEAEMSVEDNLRDDDDDNEQPD